MGPIHSSIKPARHDPLRAASSDSAGSNGASFRHTYGSAGSRNNSGSWGHSCFHLRCAPPGRRCRGNCQLHAPCKRYRR